MFSIHLVCLKPNQKMIAQRILRDFHFPNVPRFLYLASILSQPIINVINLKKIENISY